MSATDALLRVLEATIREWENNLVLGATSREATALARAAKETEIREANELNRRMRAQMATRPEEWQ